MGVLNVLVVEDDADIRLLMSDIIRMPVMDGIAFLARKRAARALKSIPVIIVSASERAPIDGACCMLHKPVDPDDLLRAVHEHAH